MGRDCFDLVDLGWCGLGWDDLRFLEGTGDDGVFEGDGISPSITGRILMKLRMDIPVHHKQCV